IRMGERGDHLWDNLNPRLSHFLAYPSRSALHPQPRPWQPWPVPASSGGHAVSFAFPRNWRMGRFSLTATRHEIVKRVLCIIIANALRERDRYEVITYMIAINQY